MGSLRLTCLTLSRRQWPGFDPAIASCRHRITRDSLRDRTPCASAGNAARAAIAHPGLANKLASFHGCGAVIAHLHRASCYAASGHKRRGRGRCYRDRSRCSGCQSGAVRVAITIAVIGVIAIAVIGVIRPPPRITRSNPHSSSRRPAPAAPAPTTIPPPAIPGPTPTGAAPAGSTPAAPTGPVQTTPTGSVPARAAETSIGFRGSLMTNAPHSAAEASKTPESFISVSSALPLFTGRAAKRQFR
jgi:hypothetical protein